MAVVKVKEVPLSEIDRPKVMGRDRVDPEKIRELAESIREVGLQEPVILRLVDGRYEVVAGDRRFLAHKLLGLEKISAIVKDLSDEECWLIRVTENLQREDLSPMETARVYGRMRDDLGYTTEKIARKMGRRHETIRRYLGLLDLHPDFQDAVDLGKLSIEAAYILKGIEDEAFRSYYLRAAVDNGVTVEVARQWVEDYRKSREARFYGEGGGEGVAEGVSEPAPVFMTCVKCKGPIDSRRVRYIGVCPECFKVVERG